MKLKKSVDIDMRICALLEYLFTKIVKMTHNNVKMGY